jgi:hypothetical protein
MCFDYTGSTLSPLKFIMNLEKGQYLHEIYLNDDFTVSLIITDREYYLSGFLADESKCCFKHFNLNSNGE